MRDHTYDPVNKWQREFDTTNLDSLLGLETQAMEYGKSSLNFFEFATPLVSSGINLIMSVRW